MDWDENGEMFFINTVIGHFWHGIQGAHFKRMHGEDPYDHIYGLIDQHADHYHWDTGEQWSDVRKIGVTDSSSAKGGGHAHVGMMIYQGTNWPKEYRGKVFTLNLHGHRVNVDRLERDGSGYVAKHEPDMFKTDDPWFRGIELTYGPDGGVYILDWSDIGECHESDGVHRTSGRIYKITYGDPVKPKETDLTKLSDEELVKLQLSDNEWLVRMARWELRERSHHGALNKDVARSVATMLKQESLPVGQQLRLYWTAKQLGVPLSLYFENVAKNETLAGWMIRFAGVPSNNAQASSSKPSDPGDFIASLKGIDASPALRLILASKCIDNDSVRSRFMPGLLAHAEDATDHNLPLMYWFGIRDLPSAELVKLFAACRIPLVRQFIARRVTEDIDKDAAPLNTLLGLATKSATPELRADTLTGMTAALKGWRKAKKPEAWTAFTATLADAKEASLQSQVRDLNVLFGDGRALDEVRVIALDDKADPEARRAALQTIVDAKAPEARELCLKFLSDRSFGLTAVQGLATFDDPELASKITGRYTSFYPHERAAVIAALVSRPSFAKVLLDRIAKGNIPRADLTPIHARQIRSFNDEALNKKLTDAWGELRDSSEDKKQLIAALKAKLTPDVDRQGRPEPGTPDLRQRLRLLP